MWSLFLTDCFLHFNWLLLLLDNLVCRCVYVCVLIKVTCELGEVEFRGGKVKNCLVFLSSFWGCFLSSFTLGHCWGYLPNYPQNSFISQMNRPLQRWPLPPALLPYNCTMVAAFLQSCKDSPEVWWRSKLASQV